MISQSSHIHALISKFLPAIVWRAAHGYGSFLDFDLGSKQKIITRSGEERFIGELHLWIYMAIWEVEEGGAVLLDDLNEDEDAYQEVLDKFIGQSLTTVIHDPSDDSIRLIFTNGLVLSVLPDLENYDLEDATIIIFKYENAILAFSKARGFYEPDSEQRPN